MGGVFREIVRSNGSSRPNGSTTPGHPGEAVDTTKFVETRGITRTTITVLYETQEARDTASRSGMEQGMAAGYDRLEGLLPT